jgi:hypothetical protein
MLPGVLPVVDRHQREIRRLSSAAILAVRRSWSRMNQAMVLDEWESAARSLLPAITALQTRAATSGAEYGANTLAAQRISADPEGEFDPQSLAGFASDGRTMESLLLMPTFVVREALSQGFELPVAFARGGNSLEQAMHTQIGDAARTAASVDIASRPGVGWVRMLNPPSCSRCAVLAGRFYRWNSGFNRHPRDDCVHVATNSRAAKREGLIDDPKDYFNSLSREEQDRIFTRDGAQAIRDGADLGQVVNARRGMSTAGRDEFGNRIGRIARTKIFGQDAFVTLEGTTTRGVAGKRLVNEGARLQGERAETVRRRSSTGTVERSVNRQRVQVPRLMPESIYELAKDRADAIRLLRRFGYII